VEEEEEEENGFRERKLHGGTHVLWTSRPGWFDIAAIRGSKKTPAETSMYMWLYFNLPGKPSHTPDRWKKLNDAFGEGWEADFKEGWKEAHKSHREAKWDARLVEVKAWVVRHRRYPGQKTPAETSMYNWLYRNLPRRKKGSYTPARWKKLNDAFGEGWEADFTSRRLPRLPV
jgi:hypothetical protein